jgi:hypothetical protein
MKFQWYQEMLRYGCSCCSLLLDRILDRLLDRWRLEGDGARVEGRRWRVGAVRLGCRGGIGGGGGGGGGAGRGGPPAAAIGVVEGRGAEEGVAGAVGAGAGGKRKADEEGGDAAGASKKAKDTDDPMSTLGAVVDEAAEAKALASTKFSRVCMHKCTDVPFLQYDKDGPRRTGPLVQHLQTLIARHSGDVHYMENVAIDLLSLACEQVFFASMCFSCCVHIPC